MFVGISFPAELLASDVGTIPTETWPRAQRPSPFVGTFPRGTISMPISSPVPRARLAPSTRGRLGVSASTHRHQRRISDYTHFASGGLIRCPPDSELEDTVWPGLVRPFESGAASDAIGQSSHRLIACLYPCSPRCGRRCATLVASPRRGCAGWLVGSVRTSSARGGCCDRL